MFPAAVKLNIPKLHWEIHFIDTLRMEEWVGLYFESWPAAEQRAGAGVGSIILIENIIIRPLCRGYNGPATKTRLKIHNEIFPQDEKKGGNCVSQANTGDQNYANKNLVSGPLKPQACWDIRIPREREDILR